MTYRHLHAALLVALTAAYAGTVLLANVLVTELGVIPVGFGLSAPAAVLAVGLALVIRDVLHDAAGDRWPAYVAAGIATGALLSVLVAPAQLVAASVAAFVFAEVLDTAVYAPLRRRGFAIAALVSSAVGAVVDSLTFLELAPPIVPGLDNRELLAGQLVGKLEAVLAVVLVVAGVRRWLGHRRA